MAQFFSAVVAVPGTPQLLCSTTVPAQAAVTGGLAGKIAPRGSCVTFTAGPANTAAKSIFIGGATMSVSGKTGIGIALLPGASIVLPVASQLDLGDFWIDTDSVAATERLFVTVCG